MDTRQQAEQRVANAMRAMDLFNLGRLVDRAEQLAIQSKATLDARRSIPERKEAAR